ncbi:cytochrome b5-like isoform X1 [Rhodamnia argentea]|uniref:Cytochrome b5-like isoform X1 n=1 Tax=Rhodamnia argentea TaxID=178133 RepID=A0ABM3H541_9MYRT|nr:cytochrome b5-like isoform X1 [Rhodamnia argentea]
MRKERERWGETARCTLCRRFLSTTRPRTVGLSLRASFYGECMVMGVNFYLRIAYPVLVYDVTKFMEDHPGGDEVLLSSTGKDATDDFEDVGHSSSARAMMDDFYIGEIDTSTIPDKSKYTPPKQPQYNHDKTPEFVIKLLQFLVPLLILGLAFGVRFYTKSA